MIIETIKAINGNLKVDQYMDIKGDEDPGTGLMIIRIFFSQSAKYLYYKGREDLAILDHKDINLWEIKKGGE